MFTRAAFFSIPHRNGRDCPSQIALARLPSLLLPSCNVIHAAAAKTLSVLGGSAILTNPPHPSNPEKKEIVQRRPGWETERGEEQW